MGSGASKSLLPLDAGDAEAVMVRAVEVALSTTINNAVTANVAWAQHPPSISEVLRSVGKSIIAHANTHETTLLRAAELLPQREDELEAVEPLDDMFHVVEALQKSMNETVAANVAWAQHPPSISEVLRSVGNTLITNANTHETTLLPAESVPQPEDEPETADVLSSQHIAPVLPIASEYKQLLSVRVSPRTTPAFRTGWPHHRDLAGAR